MSTEKPIALEVVSVDKSFGSVHALSDVSMRFRRGVVTALGGLSTVPPAGGAPLAVAWLTTEPLSRSACLIR